MNKKLKQLFVLLLGMAIILPLSAQDKAENEYQFKDDKRVKTTPVKDQASSGTCWCFASMSFIETELLRMGKGEYNLSAMYMVYHTYLEKAKSFVRLHSKTNFSAGGAFHDVFNMAKMYGMVPESVYSGLNYGEKRHRHGELDAILQGYVKSMASAKKPTPSWLKGYCGILDAYLGKLPEKFNYNGVEYTPMSFYKSTGFNPDDYVALTSYTHHPFYEKFILEIPDNWMKESTYNLPLDELMKVMDNAIEHDYSIAWGADVSEKGFVRSKGVANVPLTQGVDMTDSEQAKWDKLTKTEQESGSAHVEREITQEIRQAGFDNFETTDDHAMHIIGIAHDQDGTKYYIVKNSWGADWAYDGYFYASESYVKYKTMEIMVHKNALPKDIKKKLKIK